jgi:hypothetical protein
MNRFADSEASYMARLQHGPCRCFHARNYHFCCRCGQGLLLLLDLVIKVFSFSSEKVKGSTVELRLAVSGWT